MPTDRPILFKAYMVQALQQGRKTMTRRMAWLQSATVAREIIRGPLVAEPPRERCAFGKLWWPTVWQSVKPGDRLWVRETWRVDDFGDVCPTCSGMGRKHAAPVCGDCQGTGTCTIYRADVPDDVNRETAGIIKWKSAMMMPRQRSRITLVVTDVKAERLWEISEADAEREGVVYETADPPLYYVPGLPGPVRNLDSTAAVGIEEVMPWRTEQERFTHAAWSFAKLWAAVNGGASWTANPTVVAVGFTVHQVNIDAMESRNVTAAA